jgi:heterodisulfide reductase subunit A-like polyferredoxin
MYSLRSLLCISNVLFAGGILAEKSRVIEKDVIVIGAGAAGAHAAVRLRDMGQKVVVIEKEDTIVRKFPSFSL